MGVFVNWREAIEWLNLHNARVDFYSNAVHVTISMPSGGTWMLGKRYLELPKACDELEIEYARQAKEIAQAQPTIDEVWGKEAT